MTVVKRGGKYSLVKTVPVRYRGVEERKQVWLSLHTDSELLAKQKASMIWQHQIDAWEARLAGDTDDAQAQFDAAKELAAVRGFNYLPAAKVAALPRKELLERIDAATDQHEAKAVLGAVEQPSITVSQALLMYWGLSKDKTLGKSDDQIRRWKNPIKKAVKNFIAVVGDKSLSDIQPDDTLDFRDWWYDRLREEGLSTNTANKDIIHFGKVLKTVNRMKRLSLNLPLSDLSFAEDEAEARDPFSDKWITERLLADGALDGLNAEARAIFLVMINTGARPSEIAGLRTQDIRLTHNVPHISIEPYDGHALKTKTSKREIPLTGVSLEAMREFPDGFPRYAKSSASLSATVNKYLRGNGLKETDRTTMYSLRHSFEDRMLAKPTVDERIRKDLMGHSLGRERYGGGATLEHTEALLQAKAI